VNAPPDGDDLSDDPTILRDIAAIHRPAAEAGPRSMGNVLEKGVSARGTTGSEVLPPTEYCNR